MEYPPLSLQIRTDAMPEWTAQDSAVTGFRADADGIALYARTDDHSKLLPSSLSDAARSLRLSRRGSDLPIVATAILGDLGKTRHLVTSVEWEPGVLRGITSGGEGLMFDLSDTFVEGGSFIV